MDNKRICKIKLALLKEAKESKEHKDLVVKLTDWAIKNDYTDLIPNLPSGLNPDVLQLNPKDGCLFIGDAKNSENESPNRSDTYKRISNYVFEFSELLNADAITGGTIAIATDNEEIANDWVDTLDVMIMINNITDSSGNFPDTNILKIDEKTWFIYV